MLSAGFLAPAVTNVSLNIYTNCVVLQAVEAAQDWLENNVTPPVEPSGSLATQMTQRALEEQEVSHVHCIHP